MTSAATSLRIETSDPHAAEALACLRGYYAELAERFEEGFDPAAAMDPDPASLRPPLGTFLLARDAAGAPLGCVALRGDGSPGGEVKRLWVAPEGRGRGTARALMAALEARAAALGMEVLRLDTSRHLPEAHALYQALGYREIPRYNDNPYADHWFEKQLSNELS